MTLLAYFVHENINYLRSLDIKVNETTFDVVLVSTIKDLWQGASVGSYELSAQRAVTVPHAFGGAVMEVLHQLRDSEHGLEHDGQGAQRLHKHGRVQQQQGDDCTQHGEAKAEEQVVLERAPLPEVAIVQVWRGERTKQKQRDNLIYTQYVLFTVEERGNRTESEDWEKVWED